MLREKIKTNRQEAIEELSRALAIEIIYGGDRFDRVDFACTIINKGLDINDLQAIRERSLALAKGNQFNNIEFFNNRLDYWLDRRAFESTKENYMMRARSQTQSSQRITESEFLRFEADLHNVLKNDKSHRISLDDKLVFKSGRYDCDLRVIDVHWDEKMVGDIVLVGAVKDEIARMGGDIHDEKGDSMFKNTMVVSFREAYEDMKRQKGEMFNEFDLISMTRESVINKYIMCRIDHLDSLSLMSGGMLSFKEFNMKDVKTSRYIVSSILIDDDGGVYFQNHIGDSVFLSDFSLSDIQNFGNSMNNVIDMYNQAFATYEEGKHKYLKEGHQYDTFLDNMGTSEGLARIYEKGYPNKICSAIAYCHSGCDLFDMNFHSITEIRRRVCKYRILGVPLKNPSHERKAKDEKKSAAKQRTKHKAGRSI